MSSTTGDIAALAFVGLGSNLGDRLARLRGAVAALRASPGVERVVASPVYASAAHRLAGQAPAPDYLNAVASLDLGPDLEPKALLSRLLAIEAGGGRTRETPWAPRTLDLDLLLVGDARIETHDLTLPHPRLHLRRFVLAPLADLAPDLVVPSLEATVAALLARCPDDGTCARTPLRL